MQPTLSVIIPTYNRARLVAGCVRSVLDCGVEDLEVIVVDDGSTDDTASVVEGLDRRVLYQRQANAGVSAARNAGFALSRGRYVAFLDSDDEWTTGTAGRMVRLLGQSPEVDVVFADSLVLVPGAPSYSLVARWGKGRTPSLPGREPVPGFRIFDRGPFFRLLAECNFFLPSAAILRREVCGESGGFDTGMSHSEDWEFFLRLATRATFAFWPEYLHRYSIHPGPRLSQDDEKISLGNCDALRLVLEKCVWLPAKERSWVREQRAAYLFWYGYRAFDRGDYAKASAYFAEYVRNSPWAATAHAYWLLCQLPEPCIRLVRRARRRLALG